MGIALRVTQLGLDCHKKFSTISGGSGAPAWYAGYNRREQGGSLWTCRRYRIRSGWLRSRRS
jgi:hypothetical protein